MGTAVGIGSIYCIGTGCSIGYSVVGVAPAFTDSLIYCLIRRRVHGKYQRYCIFAAVGVGGSLSIGAGSAYVEAVFGIGRTFADSGFDCLTFCRNNCQVQSYHVEAAVGVISCRPSARSKTDRNAFWSKND